MKPQKTSKNTGKVARSKHVNKKRLLKTFGLLLGLLLVAALGLFLIQQYNSTYPAEGIAGKAFAGLTSEQKQGYWACYKEKGCGALLSTAQQTKNYAAYRTCSKDCHTQALAQKPEDFYCTDSDGINYTNKGKVTSYFYPNGTEDYCLDINGKNYLFEGKCVNNKAQWVQKGCGEMGNYECDNGKCVSYLSTGCINKICSPVLEDVYNDLIKIGGFPAFNYIYPKYNGFSSIADKEQLFNEGFSKYPFKAKLFDFAELEPYENEKLFVKDIVHLVWVEENKIVPWSIKDYTKSELNSIIYRYILPYDFSYNFTYEGTTYTNLANPAFLVDDLKSGDIFLNATKLPYLHDFTAGGNNDLINMGAGNPYGKEPFYSARMEAESYKMLPLSYHLTKNNLDNKYSIVINITQFLEMNFFHAYADDYCDLQTCGWDVYKKYNYSLFDDTLGEIPAEIFFNERVTGCIPIDYLEVAMLRSLNIPAISILLGGHHATFVVNPESFIHGDFVAMLTAFPGEYLVMNRTQLNESKALENYYYYVYEYIPQKQQSDPEIKKYNSLFLRKKDNKLYYIYVYDITLFKDVSDYYQSIIPDYFPFSSEGTDFVKSQELPIKTLDELNADSIKSAKLS